MAELTQDRIRLLDKLYNLKSEDSVITNNIKESIENLEKNKEDTYNQKVEQESSKTKLEEELETFTNQATQFIDSFSSFNDESFASLRAIDINIDLGSTLEKLQREMPRYQDELRDNIKDYEVKIEDSASNILALDEQFNNENEKLAKAEETKVKLNSLLDDVLINKNDSYTRGYIKDILDELNTFDENDISTLEFLILFPEKGLIEYEEEYKNMNGNSTGIHNYFFDQADFSSDEEQEDAVDNEEEKVVTGEENFEEVSEENQENEYSLEENTDEDSSEEIQNVNTDEQDEEKDITLDNEDITPVIEEEQPNDIFSIDNMFNRQEEVEENIDNDSQVEENVEAVNNDEIQEENNNDELKGLLESINININDVNIHTMELLANSEESTIKLNAEILRSIDADDLILYSEGDYMYLTDKELSQKINYIRTKGINDKIIARELRSGSLKESYIELEEKVETLKNNGIELTEENISMLKENIVNYYQNINTLKEYGIDLDDKELRNYKELLAESLYVKEDAEILKQNLIKIVRKNGKYALEVFYLSPSELSEAIEKLNSNDLSRLIETIPEVLGRNVDTIINVIKYCQENNIPVVDEETNSYYKYIYDYEEFTNMFSDVNIG